MSKTVTVTARKAFSGPEGWVQRGQKIKVSPQRKADLARNGLLDGSAAQKGDDVAKPRARSRRLAVTSGIGDQTPPAAS